MLLSLRLPSVPRSFLNCTLLPGGLRRNHSHPNIGISIRRHKHRMEAKHERSERKQGGKQHSSRGRGGGGSAKLRGHPRDDPEVRVSKTLSYILRHGSEKEGLAMRADGYVRVEDLLKLPKMRELDFAMLEQIVAKDSKSRYHLLRAPDATLGDETEIWWIKANQGHSMKSVELELQPLNASTDIPTGVAVHGTTRIAWELIREKGLHKMTRNHIHLAQGVPGSGVISGMRNSSHILIFIDVQKALDAGIRFHMSANGVVLTEGDAGGYLSPKFFSRVESTDRKPVPGWPLAENAHSAHDGTIKDTASTEQLSSTAMMDAVQAKMGTVTL